VLLTREGTVSSECIVFKASLCAFSQIVSLAEREQRESGRVLHTCPTRHGHGG
jgi:hypothetical protein